MTTVAVGIDLGTTNSAIAHVNVRGQPEIIPNAEGNPITPSVIYFGQNPPLVGDAAKELQSMGEAEVASFFKRSMGDSSFLLYMGGQPRSPVDLSALVLGKVRADAEAYLQQAITQAVITVPAYFNNPQRQATIEAGQRAGLEVLQIINEPTAAALAYRLHETGRLETVLVYDLGGGTFDVSLVRIGPDELTVLSTAGDHNLGGKDWDDRIATYLGEHFAEVHGSNPLDDTVAFNDLLIRTENAKKALSSRAATRITIHHDGQRETIELTRAMFEDLTRDLMERTQRLAEQVLDETRVTWEMLTGVLLVGGSTRMPMVHDYVRRMSGKEPLTGVNVDEAVALGAALMAARKLSQRSSRSGPAFFLGSSRRTRDVMSHSLGMIAIAPDRSRYINSIILPRNRPIPDELTRPYELATRRDGPSDLDVYMTQGENEQPRACTLLGKYHFTDVAPVSSGTAVLDVTYRYDENGIVQVSARQRETGRLLPMTVDHLPDDMSWLDRPPDARRAQQLVTAYLAIDLSGSMEGPPLVEAQQAAWEFVCQSDLVSTHIGLVAFADTVEVNCKATQDALALRHAIEKLKVGSVGRGNATHPFQHVRTLLTGVGGARFIVVLTDGMWAFADKAIHEARACHNDKIEVIAIGFGRANRAFLDQLATSERGSFFAQTGELVTTFGSIAQEIGRST